MAVSYKRGTPVGCRGDRKVDIRLPGKGNSNYHGARPVHRIISMVKWIRTSRLSIKNSLSLSVGVNLVQAGDRLPLETYSRPKPRAHGLPRGSGVSDEQGSPVGCRGEPCPGPPWSRRPPRT